MTIERIFKKEKQLYAAADSLAQLCGHQSMEALAQSEHEIPAGSVILTIGKASDILAQEIAFYRPAIHCVSAYPTDGTDDLHQRYNFEHINCTAAQIGDQFPEKSFDRIYCFDGLGDTDPEALLSISETLTTLLKKNGKLAVAPVPESFISYTMYDPKKMLATVYKNGDSIKPNKPETDMIKPKSAREKIRDAIKLGKAIGEVAVGCVVIAGRILRDPN